MSTRHLPTLLLRADAGPGIGAGHVMRCLALGEAWRDRGGRALHRGALALPGLEERLADAGIERVEAEEAEVEADWVVIDGYGFGPEMQRSLRSGSRQTLVVDDTAHLPAYHADLLLNPNLHAGPSMYEGRTDAALLLGTRYAPLRREFWDVDASCRRPPARPARVLLTLGGSPEVAPLARRLAGEIAEALDAAALSVVGGAAAGAGMPGASLRRDCREIAALMRETDLAVSAAGSTCWELARCGVPMVLVALADNQRPVGKSLAGAGAARYLGWWEDVPPGRVRREIASLAGDAAARTSMARAARTLVDAEGGRRVVMRMRGDRIRLREARPGDAELLLEWVNDPAVREAAFQSRRIEPEEHRRWLRSRLADPGCTIYLALDEADNPVGQIRFERAAPASVEVDVSVAPRARGRGLGSELIALGVERRLRQGGVTRVDAFVRTGNTPSHRAFARAGFSRQGECEVQGAAAVRWTRSAA